MSFLIDPILLFVAGFVVNGMNHLLVVIFGKMWSRNTSRLYTSAAGIFVVVTFWFSSGLLYLDVLDFFGIKGSDWMLNSGFHLGLVRSASTDGFAVVLFALYPVWYALGVWIGEQRYTDYPRILEAFVKASIPRGGPIPPSAEDVCAPLGTLKFVQTMPPSYSQAISLAMIVLDSRLMTLVLSWKMNRFVDLDSKGQREYLEDLESYRLTRPLALGLRSIFVEGYYTKDEVWKLIGYDGPLIQKYGREVPWHTDVLAVRNKWFGKTST